MSTRDELNKKRNELEDKREDYVKSLAKAYERADQIKKKIFDIDTKINSLVNQLKR